MNRKQRNIYEVSLNAVNAWNEESGFPMDVDPITSADGLEFPYITANALQAYDFYLEIKDQLADDEVVELTALKIAASDKEWLALLEKKDLDYDDYRDLLDGNANENLAWHSLKDGDDTFIGEMLTAQSEYFNMRVVCQMAKISYSTYRGFKNNKQPFSLMKKYALLRQMGEIGRSCWNDKFEAKYLSLSKLQKR